MRITGSDIQRIIEDEQRFQAAAHRRSEEMLRIKGRDLRQLVREVLTQEGAFPEEIAGAYGEETPSPEEMAAAYAEAQEGGLEADPELQGAFEESLENPDYTDMVADALQEMEAGDMMKFSMERFEVPGYGLSDIYVTRTTGGTWVVSAGEDGETGEFTDPGEAVIAMVLAAQGQIGMGETDFGGGDEEDDFDPMEDWMEDERRAMRGEDY
jgi:hypothetical protein